MSIRFDAKVAIVTGAGGGLGRSHALELARRGAKVVVNDLGGEVDGTGASRVADAVVEEIRAADGEAVACDDSVAEVDGGQRIVDTALEHFGGLDILVTNAGGPPPGNFASTPTDAYPEAINLNLMSVVAMCKEAVPPMREQKWGRVVAITKLRSAPSTANSMR